ncbi:MAG TPA: cysteinyl-tRNA synthetase, partial [Dehalococcoidia bacterium]|nr:cysteinyl-tRNA synthetase [Dehalococcoidia bacterium]
MTASPSRPGVVTFIGSGELAPSMSRVHRAIVARVSPPVRAVFVDTPAGFEPNVDDIGRKAVAYLRDRLGVACSVCAYRRPGDPPQETLRQGLRLLERANYIFAGPGSPTYAVRMWRGSPVFALMARRLGEGASLVFASAAAIAVGAYALPVYEVFKAGADPHWVDGLDLLAPWGLRLAVVPHWNNAEGAGYDTRFCFMGEE